jgi:hypothetical protein
MQVLFAALTFLMVALALLFVLVLAGGRRPGSIIGGRLEAMDRSAPYGKIKLDMGLIRDELLSAIPLLNRVLHRCRGACAALSPKRD